MGKSLVPDHPVSGVVLEMNNQAIVEAMSLNQAKRSQAVGFGVKSPKPKNPKPQTLGPEPQTTCPKPIYIYIYIHTHAYIYIYIYDKLYIVY